LESKWPWIHLVMVFTSIAIIGCNIFKRPKINFWTDWWCLLGVSNQIIVIFTFNILVVNSNMFFRSQKYLKFILVKASTSMANMEKLYIFGITKNQCINWLIMFAWCFQPIHWYIYVYCVICQWRIIFHELKRTQTHLLMSFSSIRNMAGYTVWSLKIHLRSD